MVVAVVGWFLLLSVWFFVRCGGSSGVVLVNGFAAVPALQTPRKAIRKQQNRQQQHPPLAFPKHFEFVRDCGMDPLAAIATRGGNDSADETSHSSHHHHHDGDNAARPYTKRHSLSLCIVPPSPPIWLRDGTTHGGETQQQTGEEVSSEGMGIHNDKTTRFDAIDFSQQHRTNNGHEIHYDDDDESLAWNVVSDMRVRLRDPGLFRWPPHINILYPFVQAEDEKEEESTGNTNVDDSGNGSSGDVSATTPISTSILTKLRRVARRIEPFWVSLDLAQDSNHSLTNSSSIKSGLGTFGSSNRGVLWVYPESYRLPRSRHHQFSSDTNTESTAASQNENSDSTTNNIDDNPLEPIHELYSLLESEFPMCSESLKRRSFLPHMTISSKFDSLEEAREAEASIVRANVHNESRPLGFWCREFYVLQRDGENGQFERRVSILLGSKNGRNDQRDWDDMPGVLVHDPPLRFPGMPVTEEAWVRSEYKALRARRKINRGTRQSRSRGGNHSYRARKRAKKQAAAREAAAAAVAAASSGKKLLASEQQSVRLHDTAEEVARKRSERKTRRKGRENRSENELG